MFLANLENSHTFSNENCQFYGREKSLYVAWACFRNEKLLAVNIGHVYLNTKVSQPFYIRFFFNMILARIF